MQKQTLSHGRIWKHGLLALVLASPLNGMAADAEEIAALRSQIDTLQNRLDALEARTSADTRNVSPPEPLVSIDRRGLVVESADKDFNIRVRPRIQVDGRWFADDEEDSSGFELRRVRPVVQGKAGPLEWRIMPELAGTVRILDAWGDLRLGDNHLLRFGKTKSVIGYERLQSFSQTLFLERGLPSVLTPTRDIGIEWHSSAAGKSFSWTVGAYNGVFDDSDLSANTNLDGDSLDFGARLVLTPWVGDKHSALAGLTIGAAALVGSEETTISDSDRDRRIRYRTSGRNTFFRYNDGVEANGDRVRLNAFLSWYNGPFGFLTEYVRSSYELERGGVGREVDTDAFTVQASWVLTGEKASYRGIRPKKAFSLENANWGAFEVGLRYHELEAGDAAFAGDSSTRLARGNASQKASAYGIGLNWYLTDNLLAGFNYEITEFSGLGAKRPDEEVFISRFQVDF